MKNLINIDLIIDYMIENRLSKEEFCSQCNISTIQFEKLMGQDLDLYSINALININDFFIKKKL